METAQFETLMLAITGLNTKIDKLDAKIDTVDSGLNAKLDDVIKRIDRGETKLDATFSQLSHTVADVTDHEHRLRKLEESNA